jgi:hypothetical protein
MAFTHTFTGVVLCHILIGISLEDDVPEGGSLGAGIVRVGLVGVTALGVVSLEIIVLISILLECNVLSGDSLETYVLLVIA